MKNYVKKIYFDDEAEGRLKYYPHFEMENGEVKSPVQTPNGGVYLGFYTDKEVEERQREIEEAKVKKKTTFWGF